MNVGQWPAQWSKLYPEEPCIKYQDLRLNKREFNERINQLAHLLQKEGIRKGDRVAALMANSNVFLEILFACSKIGAIMVPLNFRLAPPELEFIINDCEPSLLFYSPEFTAVRDALQDKIPTVRERICEMAGGAPNDGEYESLIAPMSTAEPTPESEVVMDDPQFIMYTSGTTGKPKGAVLSHGNTQWNAINAAVTYGSDNNDVVMCCAPLFHIGALNCSATPALYGGASLTIQRFFDPVGVLKMIQEDRVTVMFGIPVMYLFMSQMPEFPNTDFSTVKYLLAGGSPCPRALIETYQKKGVLFAQGYGMTETAPAISALRKEEALKKIGSCGKPLLHTEVKVVDAQNNELAPHEMGEVVVRGPIVMLEYWKRPEATANTIVDGWMHTGDMGYFDEEGYLYLMDRKKDMYISGGENVYPAEVEDALMSNPKIADAGVIGVADEKWGEVGMAILVKTPGEDLSEDEVISWCREKLAGYKCPKKVAFVDELPRTMTGKILKKDLRAQYGDGA
ncbi:AMP-dependent CoA ligase/synthetase [Desulfatibacillum aliphaticivorans]|uniref:AMP-dependent CoA ligase/synthetase n=1 Tax=Desulfatibacillum aliphaticivorans TaxID=218208 RepID=B8FBX5_DESAL|nr:long-chain fatty acid--CoA ligase [Desulfatibacillum aliphaticivorans]ACL05180.1 AMP-dependent CoA ligase/synthetase [Desulfatibacillum aliphaticivorans]